MTYIHNLIKRLDVRIALIIISLLVVGWLQAPRLGDEFRVDEDFRYFYWMNTFQDPALFPSDYRLSGDFFTIIRLPGSDASVYLYNLGFGYGLLFYAASFFVTPIFFSKILPFFLMPITLWYLFEFGRSVRNRNTGIVLAVGFLFLNLASSSAISIANGLQRSFATTLIIALIYYLHRQKYIAAILVMLVSALIYAPVFALGVVIWVISALRRMNWRLRSKQTLVSGGLGYLFVVFCLGTVILSPILLPRLTSVFERHPVKVEQKEQAINETPKPRQYLWNSPTYRTGGAYPLFIIFPFIGRGGLVDLGEDMINLLILFTIGCLVYLVRGRRAFDLPNILWYLLWATLIMFVLSWLAIWLTNSFLLYLPSRYTRVGLYLFLLMFVLLNSIHFVKEAPILIRRNPRRLIWLVVGIEFFVLGLVIWYPSEWAMIGGFNMKWLLFLAGLALGVLGIAMIKKLPRSSPRVSGLSQTFAGRVLIGLAILFFLIGWAVYAPIFTEVSYLNPSQTERALLKFLETLPKDVLIAGTPCALDSVTLFAKRQALFSCEQPHGNVNINEALEAYYSDDYQKIVDFCHTNGIDYLVVDLDTYSRQYLDQERIFFEPYNQELLAHIVGRNEFALTEVPDDVKVFQVEDIFVFPCDRLEKIN